MTEYVYVVMGRYDYEGDDLIGVYGTIAKARLEATKVKGDDEYCYDKVYIKKMEVE